MSNARWFSIVVLLAGCGSSMAEPDGGSDAGVSLDASPSDGGSEDGGAVDADTPAPPSGPVVLVPAFHATTSNSWSMERVATVLEGEGLFVHLADIPQYAATPVRAAALIPELEAARTAFCADRRPTMDPATCFSETKVHLVGHSQGGLDARYAVSNLGYGANTWSVTTLSSPHRGTPLGDVGLTLLGDARAERTVGSVLTRALRDLLDELLDMASMPSGLADGFYWLSEARFHAQEAGTEETSPDVVGVYYQSWAGVATTDGDLPAVAPCAGREFFPLGRAAELRGLGDNAIFTVVRPVFDAEHEPNDGHIPVASARYADFIGCLPVDHLDLIGRPDDQAAENISLAGWDYEAFYRELSERLSMVERGEL